MRVGCELPNIPGNLTDEERAKVRALNPTVVKLRSYASTALIDWLLELYPDMLFLVRADVDGSFVLPEAVLDHLEYREANHIYLLDSEPNHHASGWRHDFDGYVARLSQHVDEVRARFPNLVLAAPPLAVMQDDLKWHAKLLPFYHTLRIFHGSLHLYWQGDNFTSPDWGRRIEQYSPLYSQLFSPLAWIVAELGDASDDKPASARADALINVLTYLHQRGDVEAVCLFLACGGTSDWAKYILPIEECRRIGEAVGLLNETVVVPPAEAAKPQFILGFRDYVGARDWTPLRDQAHDWTGDAWQPFVDSYGREGAIYWSKADNRIRHAFWED